VISREWGKDREVNWHDPTAKRKCYRRHHDLVARYGISVLQTNMDMFHLS
jgi:hypothetical protein